MKLIVIGGGATGCGIALEAAVRGHEVLLIEGSGIGSGTSCKSTKLVHGGLRYLELAFKHRDFKQLKLVREALLERKRFLNNFPEHAHPLPLVLPVDRFWKAPYYYFGIKVYDLLSGDQRLAKSSWLNNLKPLFPSLTHKYCGGMRFYDGQFDDFAMCQTLARLAEESGTKILLGHHVTRIEGATITLDNGTAHSADLIINATGPMADSIRQMANPQLENIMQPSRGTHIELEEDLTPHGHGFILPHTDDGRLLFFLPWKGRTLVGTTDVEAPPNLTVEPTHEEIDYLHRHVRRAFNQPVRVKSAWAGLRPLLKLKGTSSKNIVRDFVIEPTTARMVTVAGGKWTTYHKMAVLAVDSAETTMKK